MKTEESILQELYDEYGSPDENGDVYIDDYKVDIDALVEIKKRGTIKGSDYNPWEEYRCRQRAKYSENGWSY